MVLCVVITSRMDPGLRCVFWQKRTAHRRPFSSGEVSTCGSMEANQGDESQHWD